MSSKTIVEHNHNKVNYNPEYSFTNAECCQHLLRNLKKVEINIADRVWCKDIIKYFKNMSTKEKS